MTLAHLKKWLHLVSQSQSRFWRSQSPAKGALKAHPGRPSGTLQTAGPRIGLLQTLPQASAGAVEQLL
jgi:hypothetical protein